MPFTASTATDRLGETGLGAKLFSRLLAGIEALILAGVLYLVSSVQDQKLAMAQIQATSTANNLALSSIPALTIRVVGTEKDIATIQLEGVEVKARLKDLEDQARHK